jgi:hypothetical protein
LWEILLETSAIERYLLLVKRAAQAHSKDIRFAMADAVELATEISLVLARLSKPEEPRVVAMDGGHLSPPK